ncbi:MAG: hypothetical protein KJ620_04125 [Candidatus Edwardsbacteria bacterium]|nr:hypothetical protein [Candidatus Edwardsbacteria bacterium]MBU1575637.1 hypothetical protein [Candidatus Edwardsbacteria bacterium]MBU2462811.1 hypothetical protein [Candidatus Edwardsbacteria bacterium]MBU2593967.1 hypothetical protein [Candidatus Edwardsbacteria bacterium]
MEPKHIIFEILKKHTDGFTNIDLINKLSDEKDDSLNEFVNKTQKILGIIESVESSLE